MSRVSAWRGGSGYTDCPTVTINGNGTGAVAYALNLQRHRDRRLSIVARSGLLGFRDRLDHGGRRFGATATAAIGAVVIGNMWQWTVERNSLCDNGSLQLCVWGTAGGTYPWTLINECLFSPSTTAAALPSLPSRSIVTDGATTAYCTTNSGKTPWCLRSIDGFCGPDGYEVNIVEAEDLKSPYAYSFETAGITNTTFDRPVRGKLLFRRSGPTRSRRPPALPDGT